MCSLAYGHSHEQASYDEPVNGGKLRGAHFFKYSARAAVLLSLCDLVEFRPIHRRRGRWSSQAQRAEPSRRRCRGAGRVPAAAKRSVSVAGANGGASERVETTVSVPAEVVTTDVGVGVNADLVEAERGQGSLGGSAGPEDVHRLSGLLGHEGDGFFGRQVRREFQVEALFFWGRGACEKVDRGSWNARGGGGGPDILGDGGGGADGQQTADEQSKMVWFHGVVDRIEFGSVLLSVTRRDR
jgi:hypothetical protein